MKGAKTQINKGWRWHHIQDIPTNISKYPLGLKRRDTCCRNIITTVRRASESSLRFLFSVFALAEAIASLIPAPKSISSLNCQNNGLLLLLHYNMLISIMIDKTKLLFLSVTDQPQELCTQWGHNDELMQTLYPLASQLLLYSPFPFTSFLSSPTSIPHSLSLFVFSYPAWAPFTRFLLTPGKKAQRQQLATLFSRAGIEGLGALCMSEPHSSSSIQRCLCLRYSPRPYFVMSKGAQRKRRDRPFLSLYST